MCLRHSWVRWLEHTSTAGCVMPVEQGQIRLRRQHIHRRLSREWGRSTMENTAEKQMTRIQAPQRVLFLCTHNSSRSQMAEGLLRARGGARYLVFSSGTHPRAVHPLAVKSMAELGIDISGAAGHRAKGIEEFADEAAMDLVVTVCDEAAEECPYFPRTRRQEHWGFPDPSRATGSEEERLAVFRQVRDAIAARIDAFLHDDMGRTSA